MGSVTKPARFFWIAGICAGLSVLIPVSVSSGIRSEVFSLLEKPLSISSFAAGMARDLFYFYKNAEENRAYRQMMSQEKMEKIQAREIRLENERLAKLLELKPRTLYGANRLMYARVIARSPQTWNRVLWIDKGFNEDLRENLPVFSQEALAGKIIEVRPSASKVLLLTDPNCKIGVLLARGRHQGILFGTLSGECRMKYIPVDADVKPGDRVETAGLGVFFPKGVPVGEVTRVWKEPGQIYQTAQVRLAADLGKIEEAAILDMR